jgi:hypothetical protein
MQRLIDKDVQPCTGDSSFCKVLPVLFFHDRAPRLVMNRPMASADPGRLCSVGTTPDEREATSACSSRSSKVGKSPAIFDTLGSQVGLSDDLHAKRGDRGHLGADLPKP